MHSVYYRNCKLLVYYANFFFEFKVLNSFRVNRSNDPNDMNLNTPAGPFGLSLYTEKSPKG